LPKKATKKTTKKTHAISESASEHKESKPKTHKATPQPSWIDQNLQIIVTVVVTAVIVLLVIFAVQAMSGMGSGITDRNTVSGDGVVTIIEYSDFECPFCARAQPTLEQLKDIYGDQIQIEFRHFPLSFHANAQKAAEASECARDQGMFWEYHDILFANQNALGVASLKQYAADLGLDTATFNSCLDSGEKASLVTEDMAQGRAAGVSGTPGFVIGGELIVGAQPVSAFQPIINELLAEGGSVPKDVEIQTIDEDPELTLTIIEDASCVLCDTQRISQVLTTDLFPTTEVVVLQKDSTQAQALIEEHDLIGLPAFLYAGELTDAFNYNQVEGAFALSGDQYVLSPRAVGTVKLLEEIDISNEPVQGDVDAPVTIIEFSDFECAFCTRFYTETYPQVVAEYIETGIAKMAYMHFPLDFHPNAQKAGEASECANDQGKFWEYHDRLFDTGALTVSDLKSHAAALDLDQTQFDECLDSGKYTQEVMDDMAVGSAAGVSGTPGFVVNGVLIVGAQPFDVFEQVIEAELAQ
jgi:protein-disulfide isomerase